MRIIFTALFSWIAFSSVISCGKKTAGNQTPIPSQTINYTGTFKKMDSATSSASGTVSVAFNPSTLAVAYSITWHSLSSLPIAMHFHDNGPVIITITGYPISLDQTFSGTTSFDNTQATDLASGYIFIMIHTTNYPGGEIMAPLVKQ